jgi:hypothetical protein
MNVSEPKVVLYYVERAEALLAGRTETDECLTPQDRDQLQKLMTKVKALATTIDVHVPVLHGQLNTLLLFAEMVGALGPRHESIKARAAAASAEMARIRKRVKTGSDFIDSVIEKECHATPDAKGSTLLVRVNKRLAKHGWKISDDAFYRRRKKIRALIDSGENRSAF